MWKDQKMKVSWILASLCAVLILYHGPEYFKWRLWIKVSRKVPKQIEIPEVF